MIRPNCVVFAVVVAAACGSSSSPGPVAEIADAAGRVEGSERARPQDWAPAAVGTRFDDGDAVRTGADSKARIRLLRGTGTLRMGSLAVIRFGRTGGLPQIALETGEAEIEIADGVLVVDTAAGPARLRAGSRARLARTGDATQLAVVVGMAEIERAGAEPIEVAAGSEVMLSAGGVNAVAAEPVPDADVDAGVSVADAGIAASDASVADPAPRLRGRALTLAPPPARTDVALPAGETLVLHDPRPPTAASLPVTACPGDAVVELRRGRRRTYYRGAGTVGLELARGRTSYRVYCVDGAGMKPTDERGTVRVLRDDGRRKVRTRAPRNDVDADGRTYRLVYQNRKPTITFRWPAAAKTTAYQLVVQGARGPARRYRTSKPSYVLPSGKLAEGAYRWWFEADGKRSKVTRLVLDFDNAAPVAQIDGAAWTADSVEVRGLVTVGSSVSIGGTELELDRDHRFRARVARQEGENAVTIRIVRPGGSVHYYVERAPAGR